MKSMIKFLGVMLAAGALSLAVGCDETLEERQETTVKEDGTIVKEKEEIKQTPDGDLVKEESKTVENP